jgi:hypothetical protein
VAAAEQEPVDDVDVGVGVGVGVTLLHSLDSPPLLSGGLHSRSRLTDQNVYLPRPTLCANVSTVWKSLW